MKTETMQRSISPREFHRRCVQGLPSEIIDVRTAPEFAGEHVAGARSSPLHELDAERFLQHRANSEAPLYIICQSGTRATKAMEKFRHAGFENCVLIQGGMDAWAADDLPVQRGETRVLPLQRQVHLIVGISGIAGALLALTVSEWFALIPLVTGCGLTINGLTGWCGLGLILARMPWNQSIPCRAEACCTK